MLRESYTRSFAIYNLLCTESNGYILHGVGMTNSHYAITTTTPGHAGLAGHSTAPIA